MTEEQVKPGSLSDLMKQRCLPVWTSQTVNLKEKYALIIFEQPQTLFSVLVASSLQVVNKTNM
jgi:hypothetical protein